MSIISPPHPDTGTALQAAYLTLKSSKEGPGQKEKAFDKTENAISSASQNSTLTFLNDFYSANSAVISSAAEGLASFDSKTVDNAIAGFTESVKVVLNGLDALKGIHPFIGVAVVAFRLVVTLDLQRRENNQKVLAVQVQMQQMICTLFQLRRVKDPDELGPDGTVLKDRMQPLMEKIAHDIKECGSACDVYLKTGFLAKTLKSKIYEGRLTAYVTKFLDYKDQLDKALTIHIALGVDAANEKLVTQTTKLELIEKKLDMLFRRLDTPRERDVLEFLVKNGGPEAVVERNDLVQALVDKSGESLSNLADKARTSRKSEIDSVREKLKKVVTEDLDAVFKQNFTLFDRKLEIQSRNITDAIEKQGQYIVSMLSAGTYDKIKDDHLKSLWRVMEWKGSVKARHFVLALRDYFTDQFSADTPHPNNLIVRIPSSPSSLNQRTLLPLLQPMAQADHWALQYINISKLNVISEAIDDDGTGFISIKEANTFANDRPKGWSLLNWLAFWAQGWETSLADYKNKILLILQEMDRLHHDVLVENRNPVDRYLMEPAILSAHLVLRSTKLAEEYDQVAPELLSKTQSYVAAEEQRLQKNLEQIGYDLDTPATVTLVTGPGRIERYLFPLLYLILKRHLAVFHYAQRLLVDIEEFQHMAHTIGSIFDVVNHRIDNLRAIYKQIHLDINAHLKNCYFGMFHDFALHDIKGYYAYGSEPSLIMTWEDTSKTKDEDKPISFIEHPENAKPLFSTESMDNVGISEDWRNWPLHCFDTNPMTGGMDGFWAGHFWVSGETDTKPDLSLGLVQLDLEFDSKDILILKGTALTYFIGEQVSGRRRKCDDGIEEFDLLMSWDMAIYSRRLIGRYAEKDETLVGSWLLYIDKDDAKKAFDDHPFSLQPLQDEQSSDEPQVDTEDGPATEGKFLFRRSPAEVVGFWKLSDKGVPKDAKRRWTFLREAVLHLVRRRRWSSTHIKAWCADRRMVLSFYRREQLDSWGFLSKPLTTAEEEMWWDLRYRLCASIIRPCIESLDWSLSRLSRNYWMYCDSCSKDLLDERLICLTCLDSDMSRTFDLCPDCMDNPVGRDNITHSPEHTTIKCRRYPQPYFLAWLIQEARLMADRLKKSFGEPTIKENKDIRFGEHQVVPSSQPDTQCASCMKSVGIPCWVCVVCPSKPFICEECEKKEIPVSQAPPSENTSTHRIDHPLLRLHNVIPVRYEKGKIDPSVARIKELEDTVKEKIIDLDNRIASLETKVEGKLASFELILKRIASQLNVSEE